MVQLTFLRVRPWCPSARSPRPASSADQHVSHWKKCVVPIERYDKIPPLTIDCCIVANRVKCDEIKNKMVQERYMVHDGTSSSTWCERSEKQNTAGLKSILESRLAVNGDPRIHDRYRGAIWRLKVKCQCSQTDQQTDNSSSMKLLHTTWGEDLIITSMCLITQHSSHCNTLQAQSICVKSGSLRTGINFLVPKNLFTNYWL